MANEIGLRCRECGRSYEVLPMHVCSFCFGPLEVDYDYAAVKRVISRQSIEAGPPTIWRYADLLPAEEDDSVDLGTGYTPLIKAGNLARRLGLGELYLKNDTVNPTWSFKDRVVSVALAKARSFGFTTVACASTGNLANSVAAHAARAGLSSYVFIPADLEAGKVLTTAVYAPNLVAVNGNYDDVNRLCAEIAAEFGWAFVNVNLRPYYAEGSKTLAFETAEQLGWKAPGSVVVPVASGSLLTKIDKGFRELAQVGLIDEALPRIFGAQAAGCAPIATAFKAGVDVIRPVKPDTIAKSLAIGNPADGYYAVNAVTASGGAVEDVTDEEIVAGIELLARCEGIFAETAGGVTVATLKKLADGCRIDPAGSVVAYITGLGLKTVEAIEGRVSPTATIEASVDDFRRALSLSGGTEGLPTLDRAIG